MKEESWQMTKWIKRILALLMALMLLAGMAFADALEAVDEVLVEDGVAMTDELVVEYGMDYVTPGEVALYLYAFGELPPNYLTKSEAREMGWVASQGNLWEVAPGLCIGGDAFGNREGLLPKARGRQYYECDVNYEGGFRGAERIVFSNDGLIYYSPSHYADFELLYEGWYEEGYIYGLEDGEGASW